MKKTVLFSLILLFIASIQTTEAKATILYGIGPEFEQLVELPQEEVADGNHVNFGVAFEQFSLFYIPIWNYGEVEYAVYAENNNTIYSIEEEDLQYFSETYNIDITAKPTLSFWNRIGGKLIVLGVILGAIVVFVLKRGKEDTEPATENA